MKLPGCHPQALPERLCQLSGDLLPGQPVRAAHILGVDEVLAEGVTVILPGVGGHALERGRPGADLLDEPGIGESLPHPPDL